MTRPDFINVVARAKLGKTDEWRWCRWTDIGGGYHVWGGVPRTLTRGKRKGELTWDGPLDQCAVTAREIREAEAAYEAATGACHKCGGDGKEWIGWSCYEGNKYGPCRRCGATGKAPEVTP